jgi:hypothetical protein
MPFTITEPKPAMGPAYTAAAASGEGVGRSADTLPPPPQAVTRNELYGSLHPATREWKEGLMSVTFRDMSNNKVNKHQWIVLDGDIDPVVGPLVAHHQAAALESAG